MNKRRLWFLIACLLVLAAVVACVCLFPRGEEPPVTAANGDNVGALLLLYQRQLRKHHVRGIL